VDVASLGSRPIADRAERPTIAAPGATARRLGALLVSLAVCLPSASAAQSAPANLTRFLTGHVGLKSAEVAAVERGIPLVNVRGKAVRRFRDQMRAELDQAKANAEAAQ